MPVAIRDAKIEDAPAVNALFAQLGYPEPIGFVVEMLQRFQADPASRVQVAIIDQRVVGFVATHLVPLTDGRVLSCRVVDLIVSEDHRRRGIGSVLMLAVEDECRRGSATRVDLASANDNAAAHAFYESLGYQSLSRSYSRRLDQA